MLRAATATSSRAWAWAPLARRLFSAEVTAQKTSYGGLRDQDRIFTNVYGDQDPFLKGAVLRVTPSRLTPGRLAPDQGHPG